MKTKKDRYTCEQDAPPTITKVKQFFGRRVAFLVNGHRKG